MVAASIRSFFNMNAKYQHAQEERLDSLERAAFAVISGHHGSDLALRVLRALVRLDNVIMDMEATLPSLLRRQQEVTRQSNGNGRDEARLAELSALDQPAS
jgi:hypothetical protein